MPIQDPRPLAFSYVRFSSPEQALGQSARRQVEGARIWATNRGLRLDETMRDEGVSAFRGRHRTESAALGRFLKRVEAGEVPRGSYLIVESLDRLSREEVLEALPLFLSLINAGMTVVTLTDGREYSRASLREDQFQLMMSLIVMSRAHEESALKSKRVGDAWAKKKERAREQKQAMTARAPAWIRLVGGPRTGRYELIPERARLVRRIIRWTIDGLGRRTIQKRLNEAKVEPWGSGKSKGRFWHDSYIQKIVRSPATYGTYRPAERRGLSDLPPLQPIAGYFPAVITEKKYWAAQAASHARGSGKGTPGRRRNLLSGIVRCEACGSNMVFIQKEKGSGKLRCGRAHASGGCTHRQMYDYGRVQLTVFLALRWYSPDLTDLDDAQHLSASRLVAASQQRGTIEAQLENLVTLAAEAGSSPTVARRIAELEADLARLAIETAALERAALERNASRIEIRDAAQAVLTLYASLRELEGDELASARARIAQRFKFLIDHIRLGEAGIVIVHSDGQVSRSQPLGRG